MEVWKPVEGYEGLYEVSSQGQVRSLDRVITVVEKSGFSYQRSVKGKLLSPSNDSGYRLVALYRDSKQDVDRMRRLFDSGIITKANLARLFKISPQQVGNILKRRRCGN